MGFYTNNALALTIESNVVLVSNSNRDMNNAYRVINCSDQDVATKVYVDKAFIGNTSRVLATLAEAGLEYYADEVDTIYLRGKVQLGGRS